MEGVLTAGEDERAGVLVHWKVVQLQLAFCVYCQSAKKIVNLYCFYSVVSHLIRDQKVQVSFILFGDSKIHDINVGMNALIHVSF